MKNSIKIVLIISMFLLNVTAKAQGRFNSVIKSLWADIVPVSGFIIMVSALIGGVIVYNKKSSDQPGEFKKALQNYLIGIAFLIVVFGVLVVIKNITESASGMY